MPQPPDKTPDPAKPSTMASRRAERLAREAAGDVPEPRRRFGFKAGVDAENPILMITHVRG
jgi:hypothetical protein